MLKLVPFHDGWVGHDKLDLKAIYRRPRFKEDAYGEMHREIGADGLPAWDLTGALNVKHHNKHRAKGFEYVTLADRDSLRHAAAAGTIENPQQYANQDPKTGGPWHYRKYIEGQAVADADAASRLAEMVAKYGPEMVQDMKREADPGYTLPEKFWAKDEAKRGPGRPKKSDTEAA